MPQIPTIPERIVVHLGAPDASAQNVTESYPDYIKNVASSEIFPTWPEEALKANILAQISVAMNRVYTGYYRNAGYNFDITSSPAYDQTYVYGRDIYANISALVDELYNSYIRRDGNVEPLFAQFCDGVEVACEGLTQWGSVSLANEGLDYEAILRNYYGDNIVIERGVPVENSFSEAPDVTLRIGDTGADIELLQRRLNRISVNYPGIPKIFPVDGYFDVSTENAVRKFQEVFGLTVDGLVGRATWNEVLFIYNAVKRLYELNSEGLNIADITTSYVSELSEGSSGEGVLTIQYYLSYIAQFVPTVTAVAYDGSFGPSTANAVRSFQETYSLPVTGIVDRLTWDRMENVYYGYVQELDYEFRVGRILPYPGRIITAGTEGSDVRVLQEYLNYIASAYPDIPTVNVDGIYGPATEAQVQAFRTLFNMPSESRRVTAPLWAAIANVYDDVYVGNGVRSGQYPGYNIG
jgi:peptidoglycan hydrolase-like protein with peptidoglycan-binding domain